MFGRRTSNSIYPRRQDFPTPKVARIRDFCDDFSLAANGGEGGGSGSAKAPGSGNQIKRQELTRYPGEGGPSSACGVGCGEGGSHLI